ncbi:serine/threonine protein kinase [Streptomyces sp. XM83C]|uniref:Serine/threonine-protein kinase n=1 Tax=Streptomyces thermocoprophilus TaxID=78356 RepID=A0ABV5VF87_9ACTN|nr:serine/threonine-protein kinase [Streptomyces sp. XM83C]MCK1818322.1 serine/threonine protein kinase [Streptomyces sp. XM83C]
MQPLAADEPTTVGPYRLLGRLGSGGMGRVYLGRSAGGRTVAVKVVHPHFALDEEFRARFRREVEAARRVGGAWTAPVLDADPDAPVPWAATAYAAGPSLAAATAEHGPLPVASVRALAAGLAEALAAVHALGLVHRDVKPSNVLLTLDGPLLIDFGIARATDGTASLTSTGVSIGSPGYMSPEQILGKGVTGAADVFSLGAVLAYAANGEPPFAGDSSAALLYKVVHEEPDLGGLDGELRELAARCLAKDPAARPAPDEVARRLAPQGAARLVAGGWLPGALVEQVSRSAVQLLNLEAEGAGPVPAPGAGADAVSGPVGFGGVVAETGGQRTAPPPTSAPASATPTPTAAPATPTAAPAASTAAPAASTAAPAATAPGASSAPAAEGTPGAGVFGPPPVMPPVPSVPPQATAGTAVPQDARPDTPVPPHDASGSTVVPPQDAPGTGRARPGRLSVTVAADATPTEGGRGRRLSCTVALAVAVALAAVTLGSAFVLDLLPGQGGGQDTTSRPPASPPAVSSLPSGGASDAPTPTPSASSPDADGEQTPSGGATPATGPVPARYLGTWEGQGTALGGALPMGTFRVTVRQAEPGQQVGEVRNTDQLGGVCTDVLTLKQVTKTELVASSQGAEDNHAGCAQGRHTVRLVPEGDDLVYRSDSSESGNPVARLSKTG